MPCGAVIENSGYLIVTDLLEIPILLIEQGQSSCSEAEYADAVSLLVKYANRLKLAMLLFIESNFRDGRAITPQSPHSARASPQSCQIECDLISG